PRNAGTPVRRKRLPFRRPTAQAVHRQRRHDRMGRDRAAERRHGRYRRLRFRAALALAAGRGIRTGGRFRQTGSQGINGKAISRTAVLGGGAWGTALALAALHAGHAVRLWARDAQMAAAIAKGENPRYLPGISFDTGIASTTDLHAALADADCVLSVTPAQSLRSVLGEVKAHIRPGIPLVLCAKGIERETGALLSSIVTEILPGNPVAVLSGPSFAADVARGLPTAVVVAAGDDALAMDLAARFSARNLRCY